jgi:cyclic beta-1,2-glucan synthetase
MYQLIVESLLGVQRSGNQLRVCPLLPKAWTTFDLSYRFGATTYTITCREAGAGGAAGLVADGVNIFGDTMTLVDDGCVHVVLVNIAHQH